MIKVTLPNGVAVEGDNALEVNAVIDAVNRIHNPSVAVVTQRHKGGSATTFPHNTSNSKGIKIGARQDQVLRAAKLIAENAGIRTNEFTAQQVADMLGIEISLVSSALNNLRKVHSVRHGSNRRLWVITARGWSSKYRITQPIREKG